MFFDEIINESSIKEYLLQNIKNKKQEMKEAKEKLKIDTDEIYNNLKSKSKQYQQELLTQFKNDTKKYNVKYKTGVHNTDDRSEYYIEYNIKYTNKYDLDFNDFLIDFTDILWNASDKIKNKHPEDFKYIKFDADEGLFYFYFYKYDISMTLGNERGLYK